MPNVTKGAAQGDLLIVRCRVIPPNAKPEPEENGRLILARGEMTGHHHSFSVGPNVALFREDGSGGGLFFQVTGDAAQPLEHQEHSTILFAPGNYKVLRQRTFSSSMVRRVAD